MTLRFSQLLVNVLELGSVVLEVERGQARSTRVRSSAASMGIRDRLLSDHSLGSQFFLV